jgi:hypothetical protein
MYRHDGADPGGDDAEWKHEGEHSDRHLRKASHSFLFIDKQFNTLERKGTDHEYGGEVVDENDPVDGGLHHELEAHHTVVDLTAKGKTSGGSSTDSSVLAGGK